MGRWQVSLPSETFRHYTKKRSALDVTTEHIDEEEQERARNPSHHREGVTTKDIVEEEQQWSWTHSNHHQAQHGEKTSSSSLTTMCNGSAGNVAVVPPPPPEEEWSPIREPPPPPPEPHYEPFGRFPAEEPDSSSDMDTGEDVVPLVRKPRKAAPAAAVTDAADDTRAVAPVDNVGLSSASGVDVLDRSGGGSVVTATEGEPASKRKRLPDLGRNPVVQVTYEGLTRESKNVLQEALQTWAYWHSRRYPSGTAPTEDVLQSGSEAYSPALALEPTSNTDPVSVWMDKPLKNRKAKIEDRGDDGTLESQELESQDKERDVPLYDRVCISALPSQDSADPNGYICIEPEEASRCFNCGSYSHSLRNCPRPHSMATIRHARDTLNNKRGHRPRSLSRYYQCSPGGKFDNLKPGILSPEARKAVGIGELDPPPWLNRMREIGYPPGYLEDTEEESSGLEIVDDDTERLPGKESVEDGKVEYPTPVEERKTEQRMVVEYPGINAPIPQNADEKFWASPPEPQPVESPRGSKRPYHQISQSHSPGFGLLSPTSPASPWVVETADVCLREESSVRSISSDYSEGYSRTRTDAIESNIDVHGSNLYGTAPLVNINGNLSVDPAHHWFKRRVNGSSSIGVEGTYSYNTTRSDLQDYHHMHSSPLGLASPIRGMFRIPSPVEHISSPSHGYSRHNYYNSGPQGLTWPVGQSPNQNANQAWLTAQSALNALKPSETSGGLPASPHQAPPGALQNSRGPGLAHQWGRT